QNKQIMVGGDFSIDFVAAAPYTYNHKDGGGAFDDRTIGKDKDVVESLEGGDFDCYDYVTYLTKITVSPNAIGSQTIELDYSFLAAATGQPGVALGQFGVVQVNYGVVSGGDGPGGTDSGMMDDLGSTALLSNEMVNGTLFVKPATLTGTVTIDDLEAAEVVIVRIDVKIDCYLPSSPTGNLQGSITAGRVQGFSGKDGTISLGKQTIPFKNVNLIEQATCNLNQVVSTCIDDVETFTVSSLPAGMNTPTYVWSINAGTTGATFVDSNGDPLPVPNTPGSVATVYVKATAAGVYTVSVTASQAGYSNANCSSTVSVNAALAEPTDTYNAPLCDSDKFSVTISNVVAGVTYSITDKCGAAIAGVMVGAIQQSSYTPGTTDNFSFSNIPAGSGYQIIASKDGCYSPAATCGTCPNARKAPATSNSGSVFDKAATNDLTAYPIPFSDNVTIEFRSSKAESYAINLYDLRGNLVKELKTGNARAGEIIRVEVAGAGMAESMYLARKVSKSGVSTVKLLKKE
ncbi:MAG TPA: T9SS type A sorting domain-containing protein, partial [Adhaeribacter sp.]|nr:T9SS type A sorting domain-containing protein [Adhaeribacter sp.]